MAATSSVISNLSATAGVSSASTTTSSASDDKTMFLTLLVAQLQHQDPLNPTEDTEFVSQLAQFSSLEQLQEINSGIGNLNTTMNQSQLMSATSFIGKAVVVSGSQITKTNDTSGNIVTSYVYYTAEESFDKAYVTIMNGDKIVRQETLKGKQAGTHYYEWDGRDDSGNEVATGVYQIIIAAVDSNDKSVLLDTQFEAQVTSVYIEDGVYYLALSGGRNVPLTDVVEVGEVTTSTSSSTAETYSSLAADQAAKASLAADSAAVHDDSIVDTMTSSEAKSAADAAIAAATKARNAATEAEAIVKTAREAAEDSQTAAALEQYNEAREWADKADAYATAAELSAESAKTKAWEIDPDLTF